VPALQNRQGGPLPRAPLPAARASSYAGTSSRRRSRAAARRCNVDSVGLPAPRSMRLMSACRTGHVWPDRAGGLVRRPVQIMAKTRLCPNSRWHAWSPGCPAGADSIDNLNLLRIGRSRTRSPSGAHPQCRGPGPGRLTPAEGGYSRYGTLREDRHWFSNASAPGAAETPAQRHRMNERCAPEKPMP